MNDRIRLATVVRLLAVVIALTLAVAPHATARDGGGETTGVAWSLPLAFEENVGQAGDGVRFLARGPGYGLQLSDREAVLTLGRADGRHDALAMRLRGANRAPRVRGEERLPGVSNYFIGSRVPRVTNITTSTSMPAAPPAGPQLCELCDTWHPSGGDHEQPYGQERAMCACSFV